MACGWIYTINYHIFEAESQENKSKRKNEELLVLEFIESDEEEINKIQMEIIIWARNNVIRRAWLRKLGQQLEQLCLHEETQILKLHNKQ